MKKFYILLTLWMMLTPMSDVMAQRKKAPALTVTEMAQQAMDAYDFEGAEDILSKEITKLKRRRKDTSKLDKMVQTARTMATKLHATERIVIIDSIICPSEEALDVIKLSRESGRLDTYASTYMTKDSTGATIYENELANKRYIAITPADGDGDGKGARLRLAVTDKIGEKWSAPTFLTGLDEGDRAQNYPYLLSDGLTLYYAAKGPESMGGYDIFVTRADGEGGNFLAPENVGFPFNSPANDYLYVVDELNQIGWFVSDRRQPEGQVCVYVFIPNETRQVYGDEVSEEELQKLARISAIADTWNADGEDNTQDEIAAARTRLNDLRTGKAQKKFEREFYFPIDDNRTYHFMAEFRSPEARQKMQEWQKLHKNVATDTEMLQRLRDNYAKANKAERQRLAPTLQQLETNLYAQQEKLELLGKEIRNAEIQHK